MFCYQCEQTAKGQGCDRFGVCGKDPDTAAMQDLLIYLSRGIAQYAHAARGRGVSDREVDLFVVEALFSAVTNVNFDAESIAARIRRGLELRGRIREMYEEACRAAGETPDRFSGPAVEEIPDEMEGMLATAAELGIAKRLDARGADITGLEELITYGLKGAAAYADHAGILGVESDEAYAFFHEALAFLTREHSVEELLGMALRVGEHNLRVMELLDRANTSAYGHPVPTPVRVTPVKGRAIVVSGHDLRDLKLLLEQTEGKGIDVYTHGEML
ncbi:hypothetical protein JW921_11105, partial [Candidatus Fermentibacterales bacterium]|nr:hypothetical protein [Candidatus Fermentibacterales bacterium]